MHNSAKFAAVLATAALAYVPAPVAAQSCEDLILGAALSATGIYAANGNNTKNGYEFAVKKINDAGGIKIDGKCHHLKIKYYDDELTPARAAQLVERLIDQDKVKFMLGPYGLAVDQSDPAGRREIQDPSGSGRSSVQIPLYARLQISVRNRCNVREISDAGYRDGG